MAPTDNGWNEYSRLVLEQLESLSVGIDAVRDEMQGIKQELAIMKAKEDRITDIKTWKEKIDDIASPTQLKSTLKEVEELKLFKTKAIAIFMAVQPGSTVMLTVTMLMNLPLCMLHRIYIQPQRLLLSITARLTQNFMD